jgi:hypothetical protein
VYGKAGDLLLVSVDHDIFAIQREIRILRYDPSLMTLANWQKFCFGMLDLAKRQGWK